LNLPLQLAAGKGLRIAVRNGTGVRRIFAGRCRSQLIADSGRSMFCGIIVNRRQIGTPAPLAKSTGYCADRRRFTAL